MKYIITETQYQNLITESELIKWYRRRATKENLSGYIFQFQSDYNDLCVNFNDEFEYADEVIENSIDEFLGTAPFDAFDQDDYPDVKDNITALCRNWFGPYLFKIYLDNCSNN